MTPTSEAAAELQAAANWFVFVDSYIHTQTKEMLTRHTTRGMKRSVYCLKCGIGCVIPIVLFKLEIVCIFF